MMTSSLFLSHALITYSSKITTKLPSPGTISSDEVALVGHDSWIFLYKGSNLYYEAYFEESQEALAEKWINIIDRRKQFLSEKGIAFSHVIIPNKASILPGKYPFALPRKQTDVLARIIQVYDDALICPLVEWRNSPFAECIYRRNDSHLTVAGNAWLVELILSSISLDLEVSALVETNVVEHVGDLGGKFTPGLPEILRAPSFTSGFLDLKRTEKTDEFNPGNCLNGTMQSFISHQPLFNKRLLIFGNSFFEKSPSWGLTPFFVALFREVRFVWTPAIDYAMISLYMPDIVITQTCERFLGKVPAE